MFSRFIIIVIYRIVPIPHISTNITIVPNKSGLGPINRDTKSPIITYTYILLSRLPYLEGGYSILCGYRGRCIV